MGGGGRLRGGGRLGGGGRFGGGGRLRGGGRMRENGWEDGRTDDDEILLPAGNGRRQWREDGWEAGWEGMSAKVLTEGTYL